MDEFDLYDDLDEFQEQHEKKSKELQEVEEKYHHSLKNFAELQKVNKKLEKKIHRLELGFQSLLDTARAEIRRKDKEIQRLREEKDNICFRRKIPIHYNNANQPNLTSNPFRQDNKKDEGVQIQMSTNEAENTESYTRFSNDNEKQRSKEYEKHSIIANYHGAKYHQSSQDSVITQQAEEDHGFSRSHSREKNHYNRSRSHDRAEIVKSNRNSLHEHAKTYENYKEDHLVKPISNNHKDFRRNGSRERRDKGKSERRNSREKFSRLSKSCERRHRSRSRDYDKFGNRYKRKTRSRERDVVANKSKGNKRKRSKEHKNTSSQSSTRSTTYRNKYRTDSYRESHKDLRIPDDDKSQEVIIKDSKKKNPKNIATEILEKENCNKTKNKKQSSEIVNVTCSNQQVENGTSEKDASNLTLTDQQHNKSEKLLDEANAQLLLTAPNFTTETSKLCTPRKVDLFDEIFGKSPSECSSISTPTKSIKSNLRLHNIKNIREKSSQIQVVSSATTSPGDYTDVNSCMSTPITKIIEIISSNDSTRDTIIHTNNENLSSEKDEIDKCFISNRKPDEDIETIACVDFTGTGEDDFANKIDFIKIPGLDLCYQGSRICSIEDTKTLIENLQPGKEVIFPSTEQGNSSNLSDGSSKHDQYINVTDSNEMQSTNVSLKTSASTYQEKNSCSKEKWEEIPATVDQIESEEISSKSSEVSLEDEQLSRPRIMEDLEPFAQVEVVQIEEESLFSRKENTSDNLLGRDCPEENPITEGKLYDVAQIKKAYISHTTELETLLNSSQNSPKSHQGIEVIHSEERTSYDEQKLAKNLENVEKQAEQEVALSSITHQEALNSISEEEKSSCKSSEKSPKSHQGVEVISSEERNSYDKENLESVEKQAVQEVTLSCFTDQETLNRLFEEEKSSSEHKSVELIETSKHMNVAEIEESRSKTTEICFVDRQLSDKDELPKNVQTVPPELEVNAVQIQEDNRLSVKDQETSPALKVTFDNVHVKEIEETSINSLKICSADQQPKDKRISIEVIQVTDVEVTAEQQLIDTGKVGTNSAGLLKKIIENIELSRASPKNDLLIDDQHIVQNKPRNLYLSLENDPTAIIYSVHPKEPKSFDNDDNNDNTNTNKECLTEDNETKIHIATEEKSCHDYDKSKTESSNAVKYLKKSSVENLKNITAQENVIASYEDITSGNIENSKEQISSHEHEKQKKESPTLNDSNLQEKSTLKEIYELTDLNSNKIAQVQKHTEKILQETPTNYKNIAKTPIKSCNSRQLDTLSPFRDEVQNKNLNEFDSDIDNKSIKNNELETLMKPGENISTAFAAKNLAETIEQNSNEIHIDIYKKSIKNKTESYNKLETLMKPTENISTASPVEHPAETIEGGDKDFTKAKVETIYAHLPPTQLITLRVSRANEFENIDKNNALQELKTREISTNLNEKEQKYANMHSKTMTQHPEALKDKEHGDDDEKNQKQPVISSRTMNRNPKLVQEGLDTFVATSSTKETPVVIETETDKNEVFKQINNEIPKKELKEINDSENKLGPSSTVAGHSSTNRIHKEINIGEIVQAIHNVLDLNRTHTTCANHEIERSLEISKQPDEKTITTSDKSPIGSESFVFDNKTSKSSLANGKTDAQVPTVKDAITTNETVRQLFHPTQHQADEIEAKNNPENSVLANSCPILMESYNTNTILPSISTTSPTPSNFSGIFSKNSSSSIVANDEEFLKVKKRSPHCNTKLKEYILPAASVLCNVDNLNSATKSKKKLHWELLDKNYETVECEDDADIDTTVDEQHMQIKEKPLENISTSVQQKTSPAEKDTHIENESLLNDVKYKKLYETKVDQIKELHTVIEMENAERGNAGNNHLMKERFSIVLPKRHVGRPRKEIDKTVKNNLEIIAQCPSRGRKRKGTIESVELQQELPRNITSKSDNNCLANNKESNDDSVRNIAAIINSMEKSMKILPSPVEKLEIFDDPCTSKDSIKRRKTFASKDVYNTSTHALTDAINIYVKGKNIAEYKNLIEEKENCKVGSEHLLPSRDSYIPSTDLAVSEISTTTPDSQANKVLAVEQQNLNEDQSTNALTMINKANCSKNNYGNCVSLKDADTETLIPKFNLSIYRIPKIINRAAAIDSSSKLETHGEQESGEDRIQLNRNNKHENVNEYVSTEQKKSTDYAKLKEKKRENKTGIRKLFNREACDDETCLESKSSETVTEQCLHITKTHDQLVPKSLQSPSHATDSRFNEISSCNRLPKLQKMSINAHHRISDSSSYEDDCNGPESNKEKLRSRELNRTGKPAKLEGEMHKKINHRESLKVTATELDPATNVEPLKAVASLKQRRKSMYSERNLLVNEADKKQEQNTIKKVKKKRKKDILWNNIGRKSSSSEDSVKSKDFNIKKQQKVKTLATGSTLLMRTVSDSSTVLIHQKSSTSTSREPFNQKGNFDDHDQQRNSVINEEDCKSSKELKHLKGKLEDYCNSEKPLLAETTEKKLIKIRRKAIIENHTLRVHSADADLISDAVKIKQKSNNMPEINLHQAYPNELNNKQTQQKSPANYEDTKLKANSGAAGAADSDSAMQSDGGSTNQQRILKPSSANDEFCIKKPTVIFTEVPATSAAKSKQRRTRVVKVLSTSIGSPINVTNSSKESASEISPLASPIHPIFNREVSTQSSEFAASMPLTSNQQDDNKFNEIDSKLQEIFESPIYTADYKISTDVAACNLTNLPASLNESMNATIDHSIDHSKQETDQRSINVLQGDDTVSALNDTATADGNIEIKCLSMGSTDYRFEKISDNRIKLFISRKRKRKRST